jgi:hypothetical protein
MQPAAMHAQHNTWRMRQLPSSYPNASFLHATSGKNTSQVMNYTHSSGSSTDARTRRFISYTLIPFSIEGRRAFTETASSTLSPAALRFWPLLAAAAPAPDCFGGVRRL